MLVKILHSGDLHLDSAFAALPEDKARSRREEQRDLLRRIVELGNDENVDIIFLTGDLFDGQNAYFETAEALSAELSRSHAKVFISPGNHDPYHSASPYNSVRFSDNVHIFKSNRIECVELFDLGCRIYGTGFTSQWCESPLLSGFKAEQDDGINIMLMHGETGNPSSRYNPVREADIAASGLNYLALGHIHARSNILKAGNTYYAYSGCPEGRGFDELGDRGVYLGTVSEDKVDLRFCPIAKHRYLELKVDVSNALNLMQAILDSLPSDSKNDIYKIILTGESEEIDCENINQAVLNRVYHSVVIDRTFPKRDIWQDESEETLKGLFLRKMHEKFKMAENEEEKHKVLLSVRYALAALENREEPV